jgi:hypothetical protein
LDEYIDSLGIEENIAQSHELQFLKDRQKVGLNRLRISMLAKRFLQAVENNYISNNWKKSIEIETTITEPSLYLSRWNILDELVVDLYQAKMEFNEISEKIINLETVLSDYLRDIAVAESTRSNLSLQRSIKWLTAFAVIIALVVSFDKMWDVIYCVRTYLAWIIHHLLKK